MADPCNLQTDSKDGIFVFKENPYFIKALFDNLFI